MVVRWRSRIDVPYLPGIRHAMSRSNMVYSLSISLLYSQLCIFSRFEWHVGPGACELRGCASFLPNAIENEKYKIVFGTRRANVSDGVAYCTVVCRLYHGFCTDYIVASWELRLRGVAT